MENLENFIAIKYTNKKISKVSELSSLGLVDVLNKIFGYIDYCIITTSIFGNSTSFGFFTSYETKQLARAAKTCLTNHAADVYHTQDPKKCNHVRNKFLTLEFAPEVNNVLFMGNIIELILCINSV